MTERVCKHPARDCSPARQGVPLQHGHVHGVGLATSARAERGRSLLTRACSSFCSHSKQLSLLRPSLGSGDILFRRRQGDAADAWRRGGLASIVSWFVKCVCVRARVHVRACACVRCAFLSLRPVKWQKDLKRVASCFTRCPWSGGARAAPSPDTSWLALARPLAAGSCDSALAWKRLRTQRLTTGPPWHPAPRNLQAACASAHFICSCRLQSRL